MMMHIENTKMRATAAEGCIIRKKVRLLSCPFHRAVAADTSPGPEVDQLEKRQKTKDRRDLAAFPVHKETGKAAPVNPTIPLIKAIRSGKWSQEDCVPDMKN